MLRIESPPRSKKLSSDADPVHARARRPRCRPAPPRPGCAARRSAAPARAAGPARAGPARSTLPLAVSGSASSATNADGHHVVGQRPAAASRAARPRRRSAPVAGDDVGDQPLVARSVLRATTTTAWPTSGWPRERGLDLAQLDPEAADLDLVVGAAEELAAAPSRGPADQVAGAVHPRARRAERVGDEPLRGQARAGPGSRGPARRRRCTARRPRRRAPAAARRRARRRACWPAAGRSGRRPAPAAGSGIGYAGGERWWSRSGRTPLTTPRPGQAASTRRTAAGRHDVAAGHTSRSAGEAVRVVLRRPAGTARR